MDACGRSSDFALWFAANGRSLVSGTASAGGTRFGIDGMQPTGDITAEPQAQANQAIKGRFRRRTEQRREALKAQEHHARLQWRLSRKTKLRASIGKFGFTPVVVTNEHGVILSGRYRYLPRPIVIDAVSPNANVLQVIKSRSK